MSETNDVSRTHDVRESRRNVIKAAGLAAAGFLAGKALEPTSASAANGDPVLLGRGGNPSENTATDPTLINTTSTSVGFGVLATNGGAKAIRGTGGDDDGGVGVQGIGRTGVVAEGTVFSMRLPPIQDTSGPPDELAPGAIAVDGDGAPWFCRTTDEEAEHPWHQMGPGTHFVSRPIRVLDTRDGDPLQPGTPLVLQIAGVEDTEVPLEAIGVIANVTVTETAGPGGWLTIWPASEEKPLASNINWTFAQQTVANWFMCRFGKGEPADTGSIRIEAAVTATDVIVDVTGYVL